LLRPTAGKSTAGVPPATRIKAPSPAGQLRGTGAPARSPAQPIPRAVRHRHGRSLDALVSANANFTYEMTLTQLPAEWKGAAGSRRRVGAAAVGDPGGSALLPGRQRGHAGGDDHRPPGHALQGAVLHGIHQNDADVVAEIRERFVTNDLFSAHANRRGTGFCADLDAARSGKAGNGDPLAVSDLFDLMPAFLSHHPDHDDPRPVQSKGAWGRS
jgi:hypothetical protein